MVVTFTTPIWFRYREDSDNVRHALAYGTSPNGHLVARRARKDGAGQTPYIANWREIEAGRVVEFPSSVPGRYATLSSRGVHLEERGRTSDAMLATGKALLGPALSAIPVIGGPLAAAVDAADDLRLRHFVDELGSRLASVEVDVTALHDDPRPLLLIRDAFERARRSLWEEHARAMARIGAAALGASPEPVALERVKVLLQLLDQLQPLHLAVLRALGEPRPARASGLPPGATQRGDLSSDELGALLGAAVDDVTWALMDLGRHRLVRYTDRSPDGISAIPGPPRASLVALGEDLLAYVDEDGVAEPSR